MNGKNIYVTNIYIVLLEFTSVENIWDGIEQKKNERNKNWEEILSGSVFKDAKFIDTIRNYMLLTNHKQNSFLCMSNFEFD